MGDWWLEESVGNQKKEDARLFCRSPQIQWRKLDTQMFLQNLDGTCSNGSVQRMLLEEGRHGGGGERENECPSERERISWLSAKISQRLHRTKRSLRCPGTTGSP